MGQQQSNEPNPKRKRLVIICSALFFVAGMVLFEFGLSHRFPRPPGGGLDATRMLAAGGVGAVSAAIGGVVGSIIARWWK